MRFLLDTHLLLWALNNPERLASATRDAIEDSDNDVLFSTASIWEIANKARLRRTDFAVERRRSRPRQSRPRHWRGASANC